MSSTTSPLVFVEQRVDAPAAQVFAAFTDAQLVARWMSPASEVRNEVRELDARVGGRYRFAYHMPDGTVSVVIGEYREVVRAQRLVFTWTWESPDRHAGIETLVTVELVADGAATLVRVLHERFPDEDARDRHDAGWCATLVRLASLDGLATFQPLAAPESAR